MVGRPVAVKFDADKHHNCGNDNTFCDITVKVTLLITIFLCFDSFPNHGSNKSCTNQDTGNSFFGV